MSEQRPVRSPRKPGIALVGTAADLAEASIWESVLLEESIPCVVRPASGVVPGYQSTTEALTSGGYDVFVPGTALARARAVLGSSLVSSGTAFGNADSSRLVTNFVVAAVILVTGLFLALLVIFLN